MKRKVHFNALKICENYTLAPADVPVLMNAAIGYGVAAKAKL
jgi:hypothetical protein